MEHVWCEEEAIGLLEDLLEALPAGAAKAEALPPLSMGTLVLVAEGLCAPDQQQQQRKCIIDGEQRILALCLILAASRACLLESSSAAGFEAAKQIRLMLVQGGNLMEGLPEQLRVQLGTKDDTAFLRRLLVEPTCQPGSAELSGDMQPRLWTCLQLYRRRLAKLGLRRLQLLVRFIQARVCVTVFRLPSPEALSLLLVCAWLPDLLRLNWLLETGYLPEGGYKLAASADIVISLGGRLLPLHRAVLSAGSGVLRQALEADDSTDGRAAAVQDALQGQPLPGVQLFLRLLYSGSAGAAEDMEDPWALASAAALAHSLYASGVLKACDARLCCLLDPTADWPAWLVLADRYGLRQLRCIAAERVLTDLVKHCSKEERRQMLQKLGGLGAGTYGLLFETTLETAASYRVELTHWKDKGLPISTGSLP